METIQTKVNKIGKAGKVISIVLIVLLSIGALALVLGGIVCTVLPKDAVQVTVQPNVDVLVNKSLAGKDWDWATIDEMLDEANVEMDKELDGIKLEKTENGLMVHVRDLDELENFGVRDALKAIWAGLIGIASAIITLVMFLKLSDAFRTCRSPFEEPVIKRMTTFAWTLIICAVVSCLARASVAAILTSWQRMSVNLNMTSVFTALIVFFLAMIFRYGAQLQQEADETL